MSSGQLINLVCPQMTASVKPRLFALQEQSEQAESALQDCSS